ncbi:MAG: hypothetical protein ABUL62_09245 [Myxococcales bacterium]
MAPTSTDENGISTALWSVAVVGVLLVVVAPFASGSLPRFSVLLGVLLALANLWTVVRFVRAFLFPAGVRAPWVLLALLKLTVLFVGVWFLVRNGSAQVLPMLVGYAALPLGIVVSTLKSAAPATEQGSR